MHTSINMLSFNENENMKKIHDKEFFRTVYGEEELKKIETMTEFKNLFKDIDNNLSENMENYFKTIAEKLFNEFIIVANTKNYRLAEIEFYMHHEEKHPDTFIHAKAKGDINEARENQKEMGLWYFHYSGIDITFGDGDGDKRYGSILLRSIIDVENPENPIKGPLKLKDRLLNNYTSINSKTPFLQLVYSSSGEKKTIKEIKPRINLGKENNEKYRAKSYNFSI